MKYVVVALVSGFVGWFAVHTWGIGALVPACVVCFLFGWLAAEVTS